MTGIIRWWGFIIAPVVFFVTADMIQKGSYHLRKIFMTLILSSIVYLLWKYRKLKFDSKIYILKEDKNKLSSSSN
jgi:hypothetical protein